MSTYTPKNPSIAAESFMVPVRRLITLKPEIDALDAIKKLLKHKISGAPVVDSDNTFRGVFSEKCSMRFLLNAAYEELPSGTVEAFMDTDLKRVITPSHDLLAVAEVFITTPYRRLPVIDNGKLVGQVSRRDVLNTAVQTLDKFGKSESNKLLYLSALVSREDSPL